MPTLHLPAAHTDTDVALATEVAHVVGSHELYVTWTHGEGPGLPPEVETLTPDETPGERDLPVRRGRRGDGPGHLGALAGADPPAEHARGAPGAARRPPRPALGGRRTDALAEGWSAKPSSEDGCSAPPPRLYAASDCAETAAAAAAGAGSSPSGGLAPSRAHGSSNSTRQRPSSVCISASLARKERPERPLKPVTAFSVRPLRDQLAGDRRRQRLARLALPDHEPAARVLAPPAGEALAVLDDVVAADRAGAEVRAAGCGCP